MILGIPKEIKKNENRVGMTPTGVSDLIANGHTVYVETGAGTGSGFSDTEYMEAGGIITKTASETWQKAQMIIKVKEPLEPEFQFFREGLIIYTYLHLAPEFELTKHLLEQKVTGIAYETVEFSDGFLPLLAPMSEVAGRMSAQIGATLLQKINGGKGMLLGGIAGVLPAEVVIIGGGVVGLNAAKTAVGLGASVIIIERTPKRCAQLEDIFMGRVKTLISSRGNIANAVKNADLLVGAVLVAGAKAPKVVTEEMVKTMQPGSVIVDVAIDQGGCIETVDRITSHDNPYFIKHNVVHYSVANMPGAVPRTSTFALTNATLPYAIKIANLGIEKAVENDLPLQKGINTYKGHLTNESVAASQGKTYTPYKSIK